MTPEPSKHMNQGDDMTTTQKVQAKFGIDPSGPDEVFVGFHNPSDRWNGFACPEFDRDNAQRVALWIMSHQPDEYDFQWDGDVLVMTESFGVSDDDVEVTRMEGPMYPIGAHAWTWSEVTDATTGV